MVLPVPSEVTLKGMGKVQQNQTTKRVYIQHLFGVRIADNITLYDVQTLELDINLALSHERCKLWDTKRYRMSIHWSIAKVFSEQ